MNQLHQLLADAASRARFEKVRESFKPGQGDSKALLQLFMVIAAAVVIVVVAAHIVATLKRRKADGVHGRSAAATFRDALHWLKLSWVDRMLLMWVARHAKLESPCLLIFTPELLDAHSRRWIQTLPIPALRRRAEARLANLTGVLFTETAPA